MALDPNVAGWLTFGIGFIVREIRNRREIRRHRTRAERAEAVLSDLATSAAAKAATDAGISIPGVNQ